MKKAFLLVFCFLMLTGCGKKMIPLPQTLAEQVQTAAAKDMAFSVKITADGMEQQAVFTKEDDSLRLQYFAPEELNGLTVTLQNETVTVAFWGIETEFPAAFLAESSLILLKQAFTALQEEALTCSETENGIVIQTEAGELLLEKEDLTFLSFRQKDSKTTVEAVN